MIELPIEKIANIEGSNLLMKVSFSDIQSECPLLVVQFDDVTIGDTQNIFITSKISIFDKLLKLHHSVILIDNFAPLDEGDIVFLQSPTASRLSIVYQVRSSHNVLFLTGECNSMCIMCPQPPKKDEINYYTIAEKTIEMVDKPPQYITISGGEPTLLGDKLIDILNLLYSKWTTVESIQLLTNARLLMNAAYTEKLIKAAEEGKKLVIGVPLHSDISDVHDVITQRKGSFAQTIRGLYNLSLYKNLSIEIRIVAQKANISRLKDIILFVGRYLTFISHVTIMQMEPEGFAREHWNDLWVDPIEYQNELIAAVEMAEMIDIPVRLYNYQQCILPEGIRKYTYQSISDWKNIYNSKCKMCPKKEYCTGFFKSQDTDKYYSKFISPILE